MRQLCGHQAPAKFQTLPCNQISLADWKSTVCGLSMVCLCKKKQKNKNLPSACSGAEPEKTRAQSDWSLHAQVKPCK